MKYQIKGSSILFTNNSDNVAEVTGWRWYLDSGSGFVEVATTQDATITFPSSAGVLCTVKLVALGPWGTEVKMEQQYMTVEDIAPPEIAANSAFTTGMYTGSIIDTTVEAVPGTGAGELTWEIVGNNYGLTINPSTGKIFAPLLAYNFATAGSLSIAIRVTDTLGRSAIRDFVCSTNTAANGLYRWYDMSDVDSIVKDGSNKVSMVRNKITDAGVNLEQSTSANQPIFVADDGDGYSCIEFNQDVHVMNAGGNLQLTICVVSFQDNPATQKVFLGSSSSANMMAQETGRLRRGTGETIPMNFPRGKFILLIGGGSESYGKVFEDGVYRITLSQYVYNHIIGNNATACRMRVYQHLMGGGSATAILRNVSECNKLITYLGNKYNIPTKTIV